MFSLRKEIIKRSFSITRLTSCKQRFISSSIFGGFFRGNEQVLLLKEQADNFPNDSKKQEEYFKELFDLNEHNEIIQRFENSKIAKNREIASIYLQSLLELGEEEKLVDQINQSHLSKSKHFAQNGNSLFSESQDNFSSNGLNQSIKDLLNEIGTKNSPIYVRTLAPPTSMWKRFLGLLNLVFICSVLYSIYSAYETKFAGVTTKVHKYFKKGKDKLYTFADVQGCDEAKAELQEVVEFLKNPEKFNKLGAKLPKGLLLVGPPGTGKTLLAKAVAGEAGVPFIYASGSEFDEMFVGVGSMRIRQMFESAKEQSPAIIFIDEIDAIGSKRSAKEPQHSRMSLNQLLIELDGFSESSGVIVIGATNFPETLDKALLRPGRFDKHITVSLPDVRGRLQILQMYLGEVPVAKTVDINLLARATPGFSGADLAKLVNQAKIMASVENSREINMKHLEKSKDEIILGVERKSALISPEDRKITAFHESGHAIVALFTPAATKIHKATIIPRGSALGMVTQVPDKDELNYTKSQLLARLDVAMGGRVAEEIFFGTDNITTGAQSDFNAANQIARSMVIKVGMSEKVGSITIPDDDYGILSAELRNLIDSEVKALLDASYERATALIKNHQKELKLLATALLEYETLSLDEIKMVLEGRKLPKDE